VFRSAILPCELTDDVLVVGAGIAGLACARDLARAGLKPLILDRARGVGGRCATRRIEGLPVDHGVVFLHGSDPEFLADLDAVPSQGVLAGWPGRVHGAGTPCQPEAFAPGQRRLAFAEGVSAFPKYLAQGLEVRLKARVTSLEPDGGELRVRTDFGLEYRAPTVVLALALEETAALVEPLATRSPELTSACRLLRMVGSLPCLTLIAGYRPHAPAPDWDVAYPADSQVLHLLSHDSTKRGETRFITLVMQARPRWSRKWLEESPKRWSAEIVAEATRLLGSWAARPAWMQTHRWLHARTDAGTALAGPMILPLPGGARLALAGEAFAPGAGVEAAWRSGRMLAARLLSGEGC